MSTQYNQLSPEMKARFIEKRDVPQCLLSLMATSLGIGIICLTSIFGSGDETVYYALFFVGLAVSIYGLARAAFGCKTLRDEATGSRLEKRDIYFSASDKQAIMNALNNGQWDGIGGENPSSGTSPLRLCAWFTRNGKYASAMLMEYVPYEYVPVTQVREIPDDIRERFINFVNRR